MKVNVLRDLSTAELEKKVVDLKVELLICVSKWLPAS